MSSSIKARANASRQWLAETAVTNWLVGFGYGARGVVYLIVGGYAMLAGFGADEPRSTRGALELLFNAPLGPASLALLAAGLVAYSLWRLLQALLDADDHGHKPSAILVRAGLLVSGLLHLSLAIFAASLAFSAAGLGPGGGSGGQNSQNWAAWLLAQPFGRFWIMAVGAAIVGGGLALGWKGVRAGFTKWFDIHGWLLWLLAPICQFGLVARGFVLLLIGVFLIAAGAGADAGVARGLVAALQWLQSQRPFGQWLYAAMAAGLTAFGIYSFVAAVFRELRGLDRYAD